MHALDVCNRITVCFFMLDSSVATFTRSLKLPGVTLPPFGRSTCRCCGARRRDGFNFVSPHASRRVACIVFKEDVAKAPVYSQTLEVSVKSRVRYYIHCTMSVYTCNHDLLMYRYDVYMHPSYLCLKLRPSPRQCQAVVRRFNFVVRFFNFLFCLLIFRFSSVL